MAQAKINRVGIRSVASAILAIVVLFCLALSSCSSCKKKPNPEDKTGDAADVGNRSTTSTDPAPATDSSSSSKPPPHNTCPISVNSVQIQDKISVAMDEIKNKLRKFFIDDKDFVYIKCIRSRFLEIEKRKLSTEEESASWALNENDIRETRLQAGNRAKDIKFEEYENYAITFFNEADSHRNNRENLKKDEVCAWVDNQKKWIDGVKNWVSENKNWAIDKKKKFPYSQGGAHWSSLIVRMSYDIHERTRLTELTNSLDKLAKAWDK